MSGKGAAVLARVGGVVKVVVLLGVFGEFGIILGGCDINGCPCEKKFRQVNGSAEGRLLSDIPDFHLPTILALS
jgi:hypothetical protein